MRQSFFSLVIIGTLIGAQSLEFFQARDNCNAMYAPCTCTDYSIDELKINCLVGSGEDFMAIHSAFYLSTYTNHASVTFRMQSSIPIPSDILGGKRAESIDLFCPDHSVALGSIAADAFTSTAEFTDRLSIHECNLYGTDLAFLGQMTGLAYLNVFYSVLSTLATMPVMPNLRSIQVAFSNGLTGWYPSTQTPNLDSVKVWHNEDVDDEIVSKILSSFTNLTAVDFNSNLLTRIPEQLAALPLTTLDLSQNPIPALTSGSIGSKHLRSLYLSSMSLNRIESDAFQGDFSSTVINLSINNLTTLGADVFEPLLQSMLNGTGYVDISHNPIQYDCSLSWLLDDKRELLTRVFGQLENGTDLQLLRANGLSDCNSASMRLSSPSYFLLFLLLSIPLQFLIG